jgi:choline dehydrogenase
MTSSETAVSSAHWPAGERFDYIVVGAGSAGCALAAGLSSNRDIDVLLLEAGGPDDHPDIAAPNRWFALWGTEYDWSYHTVPQAGTAYRSHYWPRGKVLGGSSSINGTMFLRGSRSDFDTWSYLGNIGWDYQSVLESFKEIESVPDGDAYYHGDSGPLHPAPTSNPGQLSASFINAAIQVGHQPNSDFNGETLEGAGWTPLTICGGRRESSSGAFIEPARSRPNLTIVTGATAYKLALEDECATAVYYSWNGQPCAAYASREIVLCEGAIDSPKLLLLSGIGPAADLEDLGIKVAVDLPGVGRNLQDHVMTGVVFEASRPIEPGDEYITDCCLFARSDARRVSVDLEVSLVRQNIFAEGFEAPPNCYSIVAEVMRPASSGFVRLRSTDPNEPPLINPAYLAEEDDIRRLVTGVEMARAIGLAPALSDWTLREVVPGPDTLTAGALTGYIRQAAGTSFHPAGTCRMGVTSDCVVDPQLRVKGVDRLRVADASIMPSIVSANTNATAIMIGWHASKIIRQ